MDIEVIIERHEQRIKNLERDMSAMKELAKWLCYEYDLPIDVANGISPITTHKAASGGTECPGDNAEPWIESDLRLYINNWHQKAA